MFHLNSRLRLLFVVLIVGSVAGSGAQGARDEVWSEGGLRVSSKSLQLDQSGEQRARIRLSAIDKEITIEASTLLVMGADKSGIVVKSMGPATVAASDGRRMSADSIEVWLSPDGWGYFRAVRRVIRSNPEP